MPPIRKRPLPDTALLGSYRERGAYTDCYTVDLDRAVTQMAFVTAFYTSPLFKVERFILAWAVGKPSTDSEAQALAAGESAVFAAWRVEGRTDDQLLLCDYQSRTRSWLMAAPSAVGTRLHFGSAVVPHRPDGRRDRAFGLAFSMLLWFHTFYARALLWSAVRNLH